MIQQPDNWNEVQGFVEREKLPLGAYVCKVLKVAITGNDYGQQLNIMVDIVEGDYTGFYRRDFDANNQNKKWRGTLRQWLPKNDGSEMDEITKRGLKGMVSAFERSNPGYVWDWNENHLVGKLIGVLMRNEEYNYNGRHGFSVRPFIAISADNVRKGLYTLPKDKYLRGDAYDTGTAKQSGGYTEVKEDDIPF